MNTAQKSMNPGDKPPMAGLCSNIEQKRDNKRQLNHHIHVNMKDFQSPPIPNNSTDELEIYLSLYSPKTATYISERVLVNGNTKFSVDSNKVGKEMSRHNTINHSKMDRAIFMDVGTLDQCRELHLVCHVLKIGKMTTNQNSALPSNPITAIGGGSDSKKSISSSNAVTCRRPCAVAVININKLVTRS